MISLAPEERPHVFRSPASSLGSLDPEVANTLITAAADIAIAMDPDGVIVDIAFGDDQSLPIQDVQGWIGKPWIETVTVESKDKIQEILTDVAGQPRTRWRQVNHPIPGAPDLPVRYSAMRLDASGRMIAVGRSLQAVAGLQHRLLNAQQSMERDYSRWRQAEARYRLLFHLAAEAVLVLDSATLRVVEANPAANRLFASGSGHVVDRDFVELVDEKGRAEVQSQFALVRVGGQPEEIRVRLAAPADGSGPWSAGPQVRISTSMFRQDNVTNFLVRLSPEVGQPQSQASERASQPLSSVVEQLPDGFVVTKEDLTIVAANSAFVDLVQLGSVEQANGASLERWLGRSSVDATVLLSNLRELGSIKAFATVLRSDYGDAEPVEISAATVRDSSGGYIGFSIRSTATRISAQQVIADRTLPDSVEQLAELVGRVSLKELVREATDVVERLCIEAALRLTRDNRASAAEMLGLSRQSLYSKMHRYGLGDLPQSDK